MRASIGSLVLGICENLRPLPRQLQYPQRFNYSIISSVIFTTWQLLEKNGPFLILCQAPLFVEPFPVETTTNQQRPNYRIIATNFCVSLVTSCSVAVHFHCFRIWASTDGCPIRYTCHCGPQCTTCEQAERVPNCIAAELACQSSLHDSYMIGARILDRRLQVITREL